MAVHDRKATKISFSREAIIFMADVHDYDGLAYSRSGLHDPHYCQACVGPNRQPSWPDTLLIDFPEMVKRSEMHDTNLGQHACD